MEVHVDFIRSSSRGQEIEGFFTFGSYESSNETQKKFEFECRGFRVIGVRVDAVRLYLKLRFSNHDLRIAH